ncbi:MAG: hypothetical protein EOO49_02755 [Flavobacterium sp.]|nr:MAG: hypothetical protein EOO49_02755 [Flavobacterium sp.]
MKNRFLSLMAIALVGTATLVSCKGKEGATDGTAADTTAVDTATAPAPEAAPMPADTATAPADTAKAATPAK